MFFANTIVFDFVCLHTLDANSKSESSLLFGNLAEDLDELDEKIILINVDEKAFALSYNGKLTYSEHVFDEPDLLVSKLPFVSGTTVDQDRNIIFRANLEKLFEINERAA